jgi:hypothetical protein
VRNSERSTWRRCRQKWFWNYGKKLEPTKQGGALTFGSMSHRAMELRYPPGRERGVHPAETMRVLLAEHGDAFPQWDEEGNKVSVDVLADAMMNGYVDHYGDDKMIEVFHPEEAFQIDVYDRRTGRYLCTMVGQFDAIVIDLKTGKFRVFEHKTAKSIELVRVNSGYGEQGLTYWWAATIWLRSKGLLKPKEYIDGVWYNFLRKGMPDERPKDPMGRALNKPLKAVLAAECEQRGLDTKGTVEALSGRLSLAGVDVEQLGEPSKIQPAPLFHRQYMPLDPIHMQVFQRRLIREVREIRLGREGRLDIYKNPTKDCSWDCGFRDICEVHEMGGDWEGMLEFEFKGWDPYEAHRLELEKS